MPLPRLQGLIFAWKRFSTTIGFVNLDNAVQPIFDSAGIIHHGTDRRSNFPSRLSGRADPAGQDDSGDAFGEYVVSNPASPLEIITI